MITDNMCVICGNPLIELNAPLQMCSSCRKDVEKKVRMKVANRKQPKKRTRMKINALKYKGKK